MLSHEFLPGYVGENSTFLLGASTSENAGNLPGEIWFVAGEGQLRQIAHALSNTLS